MIRKIFTLSTAVLIAVSAIAQMAPIYYEGFSRCFDEEDEHYGYTGGNDGQWGGDVATAIVVYQDAPEWTLENCNGAMQCLKVGTSKNQGSATTPLIACKGEAVLSFKVAPWEGDSIFYVTISGGNTSDQTSFELKQHQWTDVTIHIADITSGITVTFTSYYKHRFFLDEVYVRPTDPTTGVIRVLGGTTVDFGYVGCNYIAQERTIEVEGANLTGAITAGLEGGNAAEGLFVLSTTTLPSEGGTLTITSRSGATPGGMYGTNLVLRGKDKSTNEDVEKSVTLLLEVSSYDLEGSGTKTDPYTCGDVILLAAHAGAVWFNTYYWVSGYVLGGVKRYNDLYDGISYTDDMSLVLAAQPDETNENKYVTVQISGNARAALNVVNNPELIGRLIKVQGLLLNDNLNPNYLGKPGVRDVRTDAQYVRPYPTGMDSEGVKVKSEKFIRNGQLFIEHNGHLYNIRGELIR